MAPITFSEARDRALSELYYYSQEHYDQPHAISTLGNAIGVEEIHQTQFIVNTLQTLKLVVQAGGGVRISPQGILHYEHEEREGNARALDAFRESDLREFQEHQLQILREELESSKGYQEQQVSLMAEANAQSQRFQKNQRDLTLLGMTVVAAVTLIASLITSQRQELPDHAHIQSLTSEQPTQPIQSIVPIFEDQVGEGELKDSKTSKQLQFIGPKAPD